MAARRQCQPFDAGGLQVIDECTAIALARGQTLQTSARNSSFTRLRKGAAAAICAMAAFGASLAQGQPAATTPTPPNRAAPAQLKQRQSAPTPAPDQQKQKPTPPRRPASPQQPAGATVHAPTSAPKATPAAVAPVPPNMSAPVDTSQPPPSLPRAPRDKMRACAEEWDKMKRESNSGLPMWRDFATDCLTR